jgi:hypothetical protein
MLVLALLWLTVSQALAGQEPGRKESPIKVVEFDSPSFGLVVGDAGDEDGDHVSDVVVADPIGAGGVLAGCWVLSGRTGEVIHSISLPPDAYLCRIHGGGDIDKDGVPDLLMAAQPFPGPTRGCVFLVSGKSGSILRKIPANGPSGGTGDWARFVEDFDGDGASELGILELGTDKDSTKLSVRSGATGTELWSCPLPNECQALNGGWIPVTKTKPGEQFDFVVVLGGKERCAPVIRRYSGSTRKPLWDYRVDPKQCTEPFAELALWSDIDRDGDRDVAVSLCDEVQILSGRTGALLQRFEPKRDQQRLDDELGFGRSLAVIRTTGPGSGLALAIGEPDTDGFFGSVQLRGDDGKDIWRVRPGTIRVVPSGFDDVHHFGEQMATVGDVNGDGVDDLIVGSWEGASGEPGLARLISGKDGSLLFEYRKRKNEIVAIKPAASPAVRRDK